MTNRSHEENYASGKIRCVKCKRSKPIADFQLPEVKPADHREGGLDWWRLFYEETPYGMWEGSDVKNASTYESLIEGWREFAGVEVTKKQIRNAVQRGRIVLGDPIVKNGYVVAHPWEESAFCRECRDRDYVRQQLTPGKSDLLTLQCRLDFILERRRYQYHDKCFICRKGKAMEVMHLYDDFCQFELSELDGCVALCVDCDQRQFDYAQVPSVFLADHVTDFPGVNHTLLKLEDPPLDDD